MKNSAIFKTDSFTDWLGKKHIFTVSCVVDYDLQGMFSHEVIENAFIEGSWEEKLNPLDADIATKTLFFGVSICNPKDIELGQYNEELGKKIAYNRALSPKVIRSFVAVSDPSFITKEMMEALLQKQVDNVKAHPEDYIKDYLKAKEKWEQRQKAEKEFGALTVPEQITVRTISRKTVDLKKLARIAIALDKDVPEAEETTPKK